MEVRSSIGGHIKTVGQMVHPTKIKIYVQIPNYMQYMHARCYEENGLIRVRYVYDYSDKEITTILRPKIKSILCATIIFKIIIMSSMQYHISCAQI